MKEYIERRKKKENTFDRKYYNTQLNSLDEKLFGKEYMNNTDNYKYAIIINKKHHYHSLF